LLKFVNVFFEVIFVYRIEDKFVSAGIADTSYDNPLITLNDNSDNTEDEISKETIVGESTVVVKEIVEMPELPYNPTAFALTV
jgi:hypothetical protein